MRELNYKIQNTKKFALTSFSNYYKNEYENALNDARKTSEAICRAIILKQFGENLGIEIVEGKKDKHGNFKPSKPPKGTFEIPLLAQLIKTIIGIKNVPNDIITRLNDIRDGGNSASHDPIREEKEIKKEDVDFCIVSLQKVLIWFFQTYLKTNLPNELLDAFNGNIQKNLTIDYLDASWDMLLTECEYFRDHQNFILISPPSFRKLSLPQLSELAKINWSTIFDFDPDSKSNGLFRAISETIYQKELLPVTIEQKDDLNLTSTSKFAINWIFANGIRELPGTIGKDRRDWKINLKYGHFLQKVVTQIFGRKIQKHVIICLWNDIQYMREILEKISEFVPPTNIKFVLVYENLADLPKLKDEFDWINPILINCSYTSLVKGIQTSIFSTNKVPESAKQIPSRGENEIDELVDISKKYISFIDNGIEILYLGIEKDSSIISEENYFFKGNQIGWDELSNEIEVRREKLNVVSDKIGTCLNGGKGAYVVELCHKPGGGGTTLARRIAFDFHQINPTIIINKFFRNKTNEFIFQLSELTQKPILAIIEAHLVNKNELNQLIRTINSDKKHVVILYVKRVFSSHLDDTNKQVFLSDVLLNIGERDRFISKYEQVAPSKTKSLIQTFKSRGPSQCDLVDFSLTAFEEEYSNITLEEYLKNYLNKLPAHQLQFVGFASMVYNYTQQDLPSTLFFKLFPKNSLEDELSLKPFDEQYIRKLLIQSFNQTSLEYEDSWRPRYQRFAKEIIMLTLSGGENWKEYLSKWSVDLIELLKSDIYYLTDDIKNIYKSLFLIRDHEEILGIDDEYQYFPAKKFSQLIEHIPTKEQRLAVFKKLVDSYPDEPHFHGHLGRFLFETAKEPNDFVEAESELFKAIDLGEADFNLWHVKGMCNRRRVEYLIRSFESTDYTFSEIEEYEEIIKNLTNLAQSDFRKSREINPSNLHSHTAEIQLLIQVIQFGHRISNTTIEIFLTDPSYFWYGNLINEVLDIIDEAKYLIELSQDIEYLRERGKTKSMIFTSEGKLFSTMGDFPKAVDRFYQLSNTAERHLRPYYRKLYIYSILSSKVGNNIRKLDTAWSKLSHYEFENILSSLENNIREQPDNSHNIKLWLRAIRNSSRDFTIEDCLSVVKTWYDNTINNRIAHTEATYYRYILHSIKAITAGKAFSLVDVDEAKRFIQECKEIAQNDRFSFEWFATGKGINAIVNHSSLGKMNKETGFFSDTNLLKSVEGTITNIYNRQQGKIKIECGLDLFFVPAKGNFEKGDETKNVKFYISFRYSGLHAWAVQEIGETIPVYSTSESSDIEGYEHEDEVIVETTQIDEKEGIVPEKKQDEIFRNTPELEGLKIIGKIDLSQFEKFKKAKKSN